VTLEQQRRAPAPHRATNQVWTGPAYPAEQAYYSAIPWPIISSGDYWATAAVRCCCLLKTYRVLRVMYIIFFEKFYIKQKQCPNKFY
jgi:hypothetical protein